MAFSKKAWEDRQSEYPNRRRLTATGVADTFTVARDEGAVVKEGNPFNAASMNDLERRIEVHATDESHFLADEKKKMITKAEVASGYLPITGGRLRGDLYVNNYPVWDAFSLQQLSTSITIWYRTSATLYLRCVGKLVTAFAQWVNLGDYDPSITSLGTLPFGYRPNACTVGVMVGDGYGVYATVNFEQSGNISPGINAGSAFKGHICATWSIN